MGGRRRAAAVVAVAGVALALAAGSAAAASCSLSAGVWTCTFDATGAEEQFTVPAGVSELQVVTEGAGGGSGPLAGAAGRGAVVSALLSVAPAQVLFVNVGGSPTTADGDCYPDTGCIGGFNGGGSSGHFGGGGGGGSDVRTLSRSEADSLQSRLVVAAGGGGGGEHAPCHGVVFGGAGGDAGATGRSGDPCGGTPGGEGGGAGTASSGGAGGTPGGAPGSLGQGGDGAGTNGGGGGGGLYGGGGGGNLKVTDDGEGVSAAGGGGGGSSGGPAGAQFGLASEVGPGRVTISYVEPGVACDATLEARGCWGFDEQNGSTALDSSPFANDGTYVNWPLLGVPGVVGTAVSMDGADDHVRVPDSASLDVGDSFTLEGWIKRDTVARTHQLFNKGGQGFQLLAMDHFNDNQLWLRKAGVSTIVRTFEGGGVPADEAFHHVVATKTGADVDVYIDGAAQELQTVSPQTIQNTTFPLYFSATRSGNPVAGDLDGFAVYDRALTPAEVTARFQRGDAPPASAATQTMSAENPASPSRSDRAGSDRSGSCADLGGPQSGVTAIRTAGFSCADAEQHIRGGARRRQAAGLDCRIAREDFSGPVVRITHECTGPQGQRLNYTTLS